MVYKIRPIALEKHQVQEGQRTVEAEFQYLLETGQPTALCGPGLDSCAWGAGEGCKGYHWEICQNLNMQRGLDNSI